VSLQPPVLDDRSYADLVDEAEALIRTYSPEWTNRNPSDPGITLLELFAWLSEMLIFRADQVPERHVVAFLRLLNGPEWQPSGDRPLEEDARATLQELRSLYRAVTTDDFEALALEASADVVRAHCVPRRYLGAGTEAERTEDRPGWVSIVVIPREGLADDAAEQLRATVAAYLEPRRLIGTRYAVVAPVWAPVAAEIVVARRDDVLDADMRAGVTAVLERFLDPLAGGAAGTGWPFGRDVFVSELFAVLEQLDGVDYIPDLLLTSECEAGAARCVAAPEIWNDEGDQVGLALGQHHLPAAALDPARIVTAAAVVPVTLVVRLTPTAGTALPDVRRATTAAVRVLFHPLYRGPTGKTSWSVGTDFLLASMRQRLAGLATVDEVELRAARGRTTIDANDVVHLRIEEGELADCRAELEVV
jgi:Baseplate J-like protein